MPRLVKSFACIGGATLLLTAAACGDDDGAGPDARTIDASDGVPDSMDEPDATPPDPDAGPSDLRSGTVGITDVTVQNDLSGTILEGQVLSGAAVTLSFTDLTQSFTPPTTVMEGSTECTYTVYNDGDPTGTKVDEGAITVASGTDHSPFACAFNPNIPAELGGPDYVCAPATQNASGNLPVGTQITTIGDQPALVVPDADFSNMNPVGMYITLTGFMLDPDEDGQPNNNGTFPVVGYDDTNIGAGTLIIGNPAAVPEQLAQEVTDGYQLLVGVGPIPQPEGAAYTAFLDDGTADVSVAKAEGDVIPAFDTTLKAAGEGLTLDDACTDCVTTTAFPETAQKAVFSCADTECGPAPGTVTGFIVSGSTTDNPAISDTLLPTDWEPPVDQWATFRCQVIGGDAVELPQELVQAVLDTGPTRIRTQALRVNADVLSAPATSIGVGHGVVGFTDIPQN